MSVAVLLAVLGALHCSCGLFQVLSPWKKSSRRLPCLVLPPPDLCHFPRGFWCCFGGVGNGKTMKPGSLGRQGWEQPSRKWEAAGRGPAVGIACGLGWALPRGPLCSPEIPAWHGSSVSCIYTECCGTAGHLKPLSEKPPCTSAPEGSVHPLAPGVFFRECRSPGAARSPAVRGWQHGARGRVSAASGRARRFRRSPPVPGGSRRPRRDRVSVTR